MGLMDKFNNFEVKQESRISEMDKNYLETLQDMYERSLLYYKRVYSLYVEDQAGRTKYQKETYLNISDLGCLDKVESLHKDFTHSIYTYFANRYKVTLDSMKFDETLNQKYKMWGYRERTKEELDIMFAPQRYETYLEDIFNQIGGGSFEDVAVQQLKERMRKAAYNPYRGEWHFTLKGNVIKYTDGSVSKEWYYHDYRVYRSDFLKELPNCMSRFLYGDERHLPGMGFFYDWEIELPEESFQSPIMFPEGSRIESLKFYKNGRLDIRFATPEDARDFARTWLGYTLV